MSTQITKNTIFHTQGDTLSIPFNFHQNIEGATLVLKVFQQNSFTPILEKTQASHIDSEKGLTVFTIEKELTNLAVGSYPMTISIIFSEGTKYTFFPAKPLDKGFLNIINPIKGANP